MAIIVDKDEKRRHIALSCKELLLDKGINDLTIAEIARTAGVGKGTMYEYFGNKEDIIFEIISLFIVEHEKRLRDIADQDIGTKDKILQFYFLFFEEDQYIRQLTIYREFLAISMTHPTEQMLEFSIACRKRISSIFDDIIHSAVDSGELRAEARDISRHLTIYHTGLIVEEHKSALDVRVEIDNFLDTLFILMEARK